MKLKAAAVFALFAALFAWRIGSHIQQFRQIECPATVPPPQTAFLHDGRTLSFREFCTGVAKTNDTLTVLFFPPDPHSSALMHPRADDVCASLNVRILSIDRPGVFRSDSQQTPQQFPLLAFADDVAELTAWLGISRFSVVGHSAGTAYALAVAASLRTRVHRVALAGTIFPRMSDFANGDDDDALLGAMSSQNAGVTRLATEHPKALRRLLALLVPLMPRSAFVSQALLDLENTRADDLPQWRTLLECSASEFFAQGAAAFAEELVACAAADGSPSGWGFEVDQLYPVPVDIWTGDADSQTPSAMSLLLHKKLPHATLHVEPGLGHFSLLAKRFREIVASAV